MEYFEFKDWLAQIEHELLERGLSSSDAVVLISRNEGVLKSKFDDKISVYVAANFCNLN
jgi:hypothetical protein